MVPCLFKPVWGSVLQRAGLQQQLEAVGILDDERIIERKTDQRTAGCIDGSDWIGLDWIGPDWIGSDKKDRIDRID